MSSFPSTISRRILLAPDTVARTAAAAVTGLQEQWMLCQPREVRRSYVLQVLDAGGGEREQRIWMLRQADAVRESYLRQVARPKGAGPEVHWMLGQPDTVRESYLRQVLGAPRPGG